MPQITLDLPEGTPEPTPEQKARLEVFAIDLLNQESMIPMFDYLAAKARERGLTDELLDEILAEKR
jgi:hypothetical protein